MREILYQNSITDLKVTETLIESNQFSFMSSEQKKLVNFDAFNVDNGVYVQCLAGLSHEINKSVVVASKITTPIILAKFILSFLQFMEVLLFKMLIKRCLTFSDNVCSAEQTGQVF